MKDKIDISNKLTKEAAEAMVNVYMWDNLVTTLESSMAGKARAGTGPRGRAVIKVISMAKKERDASLTDYDAVIGRINKLNIKG